MIESVKGLLHRILDFIRSRPEQEKLLILSLAVGICSGLAAVLLDMTIHFIKYSISFWFKGLSNYYLYLIYPGIGMLLSFLFVKYIVKDHIGHGVTRVLVAVSQNKSQIRAHNMWTSMFSSALTIGFGGSVGAEAPIVYTGAAIGSNFARYFRLSHRSMTILLGCGAGAAIAGIFKAPLAGVLFTLEILMFNISMTSMMPLLFSSVSATVVSSLFLGTQTPFHCELSAFSLENIPFYILLGLVCGGIALYFLRTTLWLEDKIATIDNIYKKWILCSIGLGILIFLFPPLYGEGYDSLSVLLNGGDINFDHQTILSFLLHKPWLVPLFFLMVMFFKVFSMIFTNAGGGVGGTFGPTLFVGAITGFTLARTINLIVVGMGLSLPEQNFVLVGMAGVMAGVMQAPMTAIFLIAEISGGYGLFVPLIICSSISFGTIRFFEKYSMYTKRIANSALLTHDSDQAVLTLLKINDLIETDFNTVKIDDNLENLVGVVSISSRNIFPVIDDHHIFQGYVSLEDIRKEMFHTDMYNNLFVYNFMRSAPEYVYVDDKMVEVMYKFEKTGAWNLPVVNKDRTYIGFVSKSKIFSAYRQELKILSQD